MRPTEKPDLLLKALYQYNGDGELHSMGRVTRNEKIQLNATGELKSMVSRLARDGFIEFKNLKFDQTARITTVGNFFFVRRVHMLTSTTPLSLRYRK